MLDRRYDYCPPPANNWPTVDEVKKVLIDEACQVHAAVADPVLELPKAASSAPGSNILIAIRLEPCEEYQIWSNELKLTMSY